MSRALKALGVAAATVLLASGCAAGTHPGAAAVVGDTEISVGDVTKTSKAVSDALGQPFDTTLTLSELVNNALVRQVRDQRSITVTDAETAAAMKLVVRDPGAYQKFEADPVARDFLSQVAATAIATIKLGGGSGVTDPQVQAAQKAGLTVVKDAAKNITVDVAPRFGKWTDGALDGKVSGSLSEESAQAKTARESAEQSQQQPQG